MRALFASAPRLSLVAVVTVVLVACGAAVPTDRDGRAGRVVQVLDGDTLDVRLEGGVERVRLLGVDTPEMGDRRTTVEYFAREATEFTRRAAMDKVVTLVRDPGADDRGNYGRLLRYVILPDGTDLNAAILSGGYGHAMTRFPYSRKDEFRALEREARSAGRGLWGTAGAPKVGADEAQRYVGRVVTVCDIVASARYASGTNRRPTFLNLGRPYPEQPVTVVIWGEHRERFGEPERRYAGKRVCVTGRLESYRGKPQFEIDDPSQIATED